MKPLLAIFLLASLLAGCAAESAAPATQLGLSVGSANPTEVAPTEPAPTQASPLETAVNDTTSNSSPKVIKVKPPMFPIGPVSAAPQGWQTYTSVSLGVAVDYPVDWTVTENATGVTFTSAQGLLIQLHTDVNQGGVSNSGQDCTTLINSYGQAGDICLDAATFTYRALFKKPADGSTTWVILSVTSQEKPTVFYQMFDSFRFAS